MNSILIELSFELIEIILAYQKDGFFPDLITDSPSDSLVF